MISKAHWLELLNDSQYPPETIRIARDLWHSLLKTEQLLYELFENEFDRIAEAEDASRNNNWDFDEGIPFEVNLFCKKYHKHLGFVFSGAFYFV